MADPAGFPGADHRTLHCIAQAGSDALPRGCWMRWRLATLPPTAAHPPHVRLGGPDSRRAWHRGHPGPGTTDAPWSHCRGPARRSAPPRVCAAPGVL